MSGRDGRDHDQLEIGRLDACLLERGERGRQREIGHRLVRSGDAALANPRALHDPLVRGVDHLRQLVVRHHALGRVRADARDRDAPVRGRAADHDCSTANVNVPRAASSPSTRASARPLPIGPAHTLELARQLELVARLDDPLEAHAVDSREEREPSAVLLAAEHRDRAGLRHRLDDQHAGHDRPTRESARRDTTRRARTRFRATTRCPGSSSTTSSIRRKGSRCGRIASISARDRAARVVISGTARPSVDGRALRHCGRNPWFPRPARAVSGIRTSSSTRARRRSGCSETSTPRAPSR